MPWSVEPFLIGDEMIKFPVDADLEKILFSLGLEYQYLHTMGEERSHRNRLCMLDGTIVLEVEIWEECGRMMITDKQGIREFKSIDLGILHLLIIDRLFLRISDYDTLCHT
jgi:hypothetical protein